MRNIIAIATCIGIVAGIAYVIIQKVPITLSLFLGFVAAAFFGGFLFDLQGLKDRWAPVASSAAELQAEVKAGMDKAKEALDEEKDAYKANKDKKAQEKEIEDPPEETEPPKTKFEQKVVRRPATKTDGTTVKAPVQGA